MSFKPEVVSVVVSCKGLEATSCCFLFGGKLVNDCKCILSTFTKRIADPLLTLGVQAYSALAHEFDPY